MAASQTKIDRRVRRTKSLLMDAFFTLLGEKNYKDITVKELCDAADINRGTFYLHYNDIYDMVEQMEQDILSQFEELISKHAPASLHANLKPLIHDIFEFIGNNRTLYAALLGQNGDISFLLKVKELFRDRLIELYSASLPEDDLVKFDYLYSYIAAGYIGLAERWILSDGPESPEEMAELANSIISAAIRSLA